MTIIFIAILTSISLLSLLSLQYRMGPPVDSVLTVALFQCLISLVSLVDEKNDINGLCFNQLVTKGLQNPVENLGFLTEWQMM